MKIELYKIPQLNSKKFCYYIVVNNIIKCYKVDGYDEWTEPIVVVVGEDFKYMAIKVKDLTEGELMLELL